MMSEIKIKELKESGIYDEYELQIIASKMILKLQFDEMCFCGCGCPDEISFFHRSLHT